MTKPIFLLSILFLGVHVAHAYEYRLQFTAPAGARGLLVAGYSFTGKQVSGVCDYYTSTSSGGRGGRTIITHHNSDCTWDLFGNLIGMTPQTSAIKPPPVLSISGFELIYAESGTSRTGIDLRGFGFVSTPSAHYSWETPNGGYAVIPDSSYVFAVNLISDGDFPLIIDETTVEAVIAGTLTATAGTATISSHTCERVLSVNAACTVTVTYNPRTIACTASPYGYAYTTVELSLVTDAGANPGFKEGFTITGVPICND